MKKKLLMLFFAVFCCLTNVMAQSKTVTGRVVSSDDGYPLPGVSVTVKGTKNGTVTSTLGTFTITVNEGQTLVFSFIGTLPQEIVVGTSNVINVEQKSDTRSLKEVIVTGAFGIQQSVRDNTSAVQTIKGADLQQTQRENLLNSLQGRIAGATVTSTSGSPGASSTIVLRGLNSIGGSNSPLFVVDGVRVSNDAVDQQLLASNGPNRNSDFTNRIADINPEDIETLTVLKGADAAALYGSSASGGAIIITTKKGRSTNGSGNITYDNNFGFSTAYRFPQVQTTYGLGTNGNTSATVRTAFGPAYAPGTQTYNSLQNIVQTGTSVTNNIAFEGGNEISTYRISASIRDASGVFPVAYNNKISLFFSGTSKLSSKISSSATFNYFNIDNHKLNKGNSGTYIDALTWPTYDDVRNYVNPDGSKRTLIPPVGTITDATIDFDNPLWDANNNISRDQTNRIKTSVDLSYDALPWLNFRGILGIDFANTAGNNFISQFSSAYQNSPITGFAQTSGTAANGIIDNYNDNNLQINGNVFATAKKTFGDLRATLRVGGEAISNSDDVNGFYGQSFAQTDFNSINNTDPTKQRASDYLKRYRYLSGILGLNLVYKEMFIFNATARKEYSSKLSGTIQDDYFYPSIGAGFIFSDLKALKDSKVLSYGKLKISYAEVGKDPYAPYQILSTLSQQATTGGGFAYNVTGNNQTLRPERDHEFDLGTELQFFNGRLGADIAYYINTETNQIFAPRTSYATGYILKYINGGSVKTQGVEISLNATPVKTKDFKWDMVVNFNKSHGTVESLGGLPEYYNSDTWLYSNFRVSVFPGSSTANIAGVTYARNNAGQILIDPTTGLGISSGTVFSTVGDRQPNFSIGFNNHFSFNNFDLSFLFDIRKGGDIANENELFLTRYGLSTRTLNRQIPVVVPGVLKDGKENTANPTVNTIQVTPYYQNTYYTNNIDADFVEHNINWIRLKDITLSYKLPQSFLAHQKLFKYASVFVTATDVFLITNYSGADPDVNGNNASETGANAFGFDFGTLPTPRVISMGLKIRL